MIHLNETFRDQILLLILLCHITRNTSERDRVAAGGAWYISPTVVQEKLQLSFTLFTDVERKGRSLFWVSSKAPPNFQLGLLAEQFKVAQLSSCSAQTKASREQRYAGGTALAGFRNNTYVYLGNHLFDFNNGRVHNISDKN